MTDKVECAVVGAGVVGLAVARELAQAGLETVILECERQVGTATSSRNSEVIHAGIYYPPGSLKARLCVAGKRLLYAYCEDRGIEHKACGKLIVATCEKDLARLDAIGANAAASGVDDLQRLDVAEVRDLEPALQCVGAVLSPSTGIIDSHGLMLSLQGDFEAAGGMVAFESPLVGGDCSSDGIILRIGGSVATELRARVVVNCAGLAAHEVARSLGGLPAEHVPDVRYAKGNYYSLDAPPPFARLVYPVPQDGGLGVHMTIDLAGRARFGPDVEWVERIDYAVDPARADAFYEAIRRYWPALPDAALSPAYAGIRPKLGGPGEPAADFRIAGPDAHGVPSLVNLFGIESPGLTATLAIARHVRELIL